jgi:hypothetical protein
MIQIKFSIKKILLWFQIQIMFQVEKADCQLGSRYVHRMFYFEKENKFLINFPKISSMLSLNMNY